MWASYVKDSFDSASVLKELCFWKIILFKQIIKTNKSLSPSFKIEKCTNSFLQFFSGPDSNISKIHFNSKSFCFNFSSTSQQVFPDFICENSSISIKRNKQAKKFERKTDLSHRSDGKQLFCGEKCT